MSTHALTIAAAKPSRATAVTEVLRAALTRFGAAVRVESDTELIVTARGAGGWASIILAPNHPADIQLFNYDQAGGGTEQNVDRAEEMEQIITATLSRHERQH